MAGLLRTDCPPFSCTAAGVGSTVGGGVIWAKMATAQNPTMQDWEVLDVW